MRLRTCSPITTVSHESVFRATVSIERIAQAKADWRAGRMKLPDLDQAEFIPLPPDPEPPAGPMS